MRELPRGTVTFLFTDIEGSTRLLQDLGDRYADAVAEHRGVLRDAFAHHGGVEVDTQGDSFFVAFERASDAVACAADVQASLDRGPVRVRMGIHTGEPIVTGEGYVGVDVHRAARIAAAGHGGQVLLSQAARDLVEADVRDLGEHRLKDLTAPVRLFQLGYGEFPPPQTLGGVALPVAASALIGRERELADLIKLVREKNRLVTLTGPGGIGKTRLALQVAAELGGAFRHGIFWVPLAGIVGPELVFPSIAATLKTQDELRHHLREREVLILLDGAEHVVAAGPELGELLAAAPRVSLLVTSREPLHLSGEREYPLEPMTNSEAATLFVERARATGADVSFDDTVVAICERLDNLPLALELAARRTKLLEPRGLLARLKQRLPLLTEGARDLPERQRTLRATIQWSYDLLDATERSALARLSIFHGGWTIEAAEAVCGVDVDTLQSLVDKSLVRRWGDGRLGMLDLIREFSVELFELSGDAEAIRDLHGAFFLRLVEEARGNSNAASPVGAEALDRIESDYRNIRAALERWRGRGDVEPLSRLASSMWRFWHIRAFLADGRQLLDEVLSHEVKEPARRFELATGAANLALEQGDGVRARELFQAALESARAAGDPVLVGRSLMRLGGFAWRDELEQETLLSEAEALFAAAGAESWLATLAINRSDFALARREYHRAVQLASRAVELFRTIEPPRGLSIALLNLGTAYAQLGSLEPARAALRESLQLAHGLNEPRRIAHCLCGLGAVRLFGGELEAGATLLGAAEAIRGSLGEVLGPPEQHLYDRAVAVLDSHAGDLVIEAARVKGRRLSVEQALADALGSIH